jgi:hypothetical protein
MICIRGDDRFNPPMTEVRTGVNPYQHGLDHPVVEVLPLVQLESTVSLLV